ncbi:hypothetical protein HZF08_35720 [Paenibacillus sp. CGMCC 1.16610]|uniref:Uncharacterized protein n=1 Tax=Paenibacillus anseongense TaxID=2682845 RepID=A0ABW9TZ50_9BACL|nr:MULTISPECIES: hypothetical protein [Paenibacillus]MBA2943626.1 hypothetical protein [Paenibacillus sp. CGMCC 1.16610]MVQ33122.1 hypothetical protein [Paenibacillus anseongense]
MNLAILKELNDTSCIEIHFEILHHYPEENEGSRIFITFYREKAVEKTIDMGWTNQTLFSFINLMMNFPLDKKNGDFHHYEKHLELHWTYEYDTDLYLLTFEDQGKLFLLKSSQNELTKFGNALKNAVESAPSSNSYESNK